MAVACGGITDPDIAPRCSMSPEHAEHTCVWHIAFPALAGCGNGLHSSSGLNPTPKATYTLTLMATNGNGVQHSQQLTLTVSGNAGTPAPQPPQPPQVPQVSEGNESHPRVDPYLPLPHDQTSSLLQSSQIHAELLSQALLSFPASTKSLEYDNLAQLRKLPLTA